jgi:peptidoglycan hydrolase CwlO-like protein
MTALDPKPYRYILIAAVTLAAILIALIIFLSVQLWMSNQREKAINKAQINQLLQTRQDAEYKVQQAVDSVSIIHIELQSNQAKLSESINRYNKLKKHEPNLILLRGDTSAILGELQRIRSEVGQD